MKGIVALVVQDHHVVQLFVDHVVAVAWPRRGTCEIWENNQDHIVLWYCVPFEPFQHF